MFPPHFYICAMLFKYATNFMACISFWGLFSATIFASVVSTACEEKTAYIMSYILISFVIGWTFFMLSCISVELDAKKFPYGTLPIFGLTAWGGVLLSTCKDSEMESSNCKRDLWIIACFLLLGQLLAGFAFSFIYLYFKYASVNKPVAMAAVPTPAIEIVSFV